MLVLGWVFVGVTSPIKSESDLHGSMILALIKGTAWHFGRKYPLTVFLGVPPLRVTVANEGLPVGGGTKARNIVVATRRSPKQWTQKSSEQRLSKVFCKVGFLLFPFFLLSCVGKVALVVC